MHVDGSPAACIFVTPNVLRELVTGQHVVRPTGERAQQPIFGWGHRQLAPAKRYMPPRATDVQVAHLVMVGLSSGMFGPGATRSSKNGFDACLEVIHVERLRDEVVGPEPQGERAIPLAVRSAADDD